MEKKILIIDDDATLSDELAEAMSGEGYEVSIADDGDAGLDMMQEDDFDLVFLDLKMPRMSGIEVLQKLRGRKRACKIVVLTGRPVQGDSPDSGGLSDEEKRALDAADEVIGKPFVVEELIRKIREKIGDPDC